jgi:hypothetical protein
VVTYSKVSVKAPLAIFFYNRPDLFERLLLGLKKINFKTVYLISDGPKENLADGFLVEKCRKLAEDMISAKEVRTFYRYQNVGMPKNLTEGIDWVFKNEDFSIFLEDDTIPDPSFFAFCEELGSKFYHEERVFSIGGFNRFHSLSNPIVPGSYFFSSYPSLWGWASWSKKWVDNYDYNMVDWPRIKKEGLFKNAFPAKKEREYWENKLDKVYDEKYTWDTQLVLSHKVNNLVSVVPSVNLVSNIGIGREDSTNSKALTGLSKIVHQEVKFPLRHPKEMEVNLNYDSEFRKYVAPSLTKRIWMKYQRMIWSPLKSQLDCRKECIEIKN